MFLTSMHDVFHQYNYIEQNFLYPWIEAPATLSMIDTIIHLKESILCLQFS